MLAVLGSLQSIETRYRADLKQIRGGWLTAHGQKPDGLISFCTVVDSTFFFNPGTGPPLMQVRWCNYRLRSLVFCAALLLGMVLISSAQAQPAAPSAPTAPGAPGGGIVVESEGAGTTEWIVTIIILGVGVYAVARSSNRN